MSNPNDNAELSVAEGVLLGHALVARVAAEQGIRAFFIKGPASVLQGLRKPKTSGDVDVFVAPSDLNSMLNGLLKRGWRRRPVDPDDTTFPKHSITVYHAFWPCCIDIHYRFPGMENSAPECFEVMWKNTGPMALAGQDMRVPSQPLAILILTLHGLRSPHLPESRRELEYLAQQTRSMAMTQQILELSICVGSLAAIRPFLEGLLPESVHPAWTTPSREWRNRILTQGPGSARILALVQANWRDRPGMILRAAFPGRQVLLSRNVHADMSVSGLVVQHAARWLRLLRSVPDIVRDLSRYGR